MNGPTFPSYNAMLRSLGAAEREQAYSRLTRVHLPLGATLFESDEHPRDIYSPTGCMYASEQIPHDLYR